MTYCAVPQNRLAKDFRVVRSRVTYIDAKYRTHTCLSSPYTRNIICLKKIVRLNTLSQPTSSTLALPGPQIPGEADICCRCCNGMKINIATCTVTC